MRVPSERSNNFKWKRFGWFWGFYRIKEKREEWLAYISDNNVTEASYEFELRKLTNTTRLPSFNALYHC